MSFLFATQITQISNNAYLRPNRRNLVETVVNHVNKDTGRINLGKSGKDVNGLYHNINIDIRVNRVKMLIDYDDNLILDIQVILVKMSIDYQNISIWYNWLTR